MRVDTFAEEVSRDHWVRYPWISRVLIEIQRAIRKGGARIIINTPPRHGKSEGISHWLPTWYLDTYPDKRVILGSYGDTFASRWGVKVRDEFLNGELTRTKVKPDKALASDWETTRGGGMKTAGVGGGITGMGFNLGIVDDPHKDWEEALSPTMRRRVIEWFCSTFYTRAEPGASIVVVMTRWHQDDLTGYLTRDHADKWTVIRLPAIAEDNDWLGRAPGQALCPERYDLEALERIRLAPGTGLGSYLFAGLYQQRPSPIEGGIVKRDWFRRWRELPRIDRWIQSWDLTFVGTGSSWVVGQLWGATGPDRYLVDQIRGRWDFPETLRMIHAFSAKHPQAREIVIERAANGAAAIATLEKEVAGVIGVPPTKSKEARLISVSPQIETGNVYVPATPWADDLIEEVITFPNAANDDQVDALSMALARLSEDGGMVDLKIPSAGVRQSEAAAISLSDGRGSSVASIAIPS